MNLFWTTTSSRGEHIVFRKSTTKPFNVIDSPAKGARTIIADTQIWPGIIIQGTPAFPHASIQALSRRRRGVHSSSTSLGYWYTPSDPLAPAAPQSASARPSADITLRLSLGRYNYDTGLSPSDAPGLASLAYMNDVHVAAFEGPKLPFPGEGDRRS
jgi:hypothetical protein